MCIRDRFFTNDLTINKRILPTPPVCSILCHWLTHWKRRSNVKCQCLSSHTCTWPSKNLLWFKVNSLCKSRKQHAQLVMFLVWLLLAMASILGRREWCHPPLLHKGCTAQITKDVFCNKCHSTQSQMWCMRCDAVDVLVEVCGIGIEEPTGTSPCKLKLWCYSVVFVLFLSEHFSNLLFGFTYVTGNLSSVYRRSHARDNSP